MKKILCSSISIIATLFLFGQSQTDTSKTDKIKPHLASIKAKDGSTIEGWLLKASNDKVYLLPVRKLPKPVNGVYALNTYTNQMSIEVPQISIIKTYKKNSVLKGAVIGLASGVVLGAFVGLGSGSGTSGPYGYTAGAAAGGAVIGLGVTGALLGTIIGLGSKKKFIIGGDRMTYKIRQNDLKIRSLVH